MIKKQEIGILLLLVLIGVLVKGATATLLLGVLYCAYLIYKIVRHKGKTNQIWLKIRYGLDLVFGLFLLLFIVVESFFILNIIAHKNYLPKAQYVVILGAGLAGDIPKLSLKYRLERAVEYHRKYPHAEFILSGGQGVDEWISEAEAMRRYLVANGVPEPLLHLEDQSTTTEENLRFSMQYIHNNKIKSATKIGVISNNFHLYRVDVIAKSLGIEIEPIHAKAVWYLLPRDLTREFFALGNEYRKRALSLHTFDNP